MANKRGTPLGSYGSLISVVIPAFNQPVYLRRAIQSVMDQNYRPIELIISDDCSPTLLEPVVREFDAFKNEHFTIRYFRQPQNRGVMDNFKFAVTQASGKYIVPMPHDNRFIDRGFFSESVKIMREHSDCHLCYGNALYESIGEKALDIPGTIRFRDGWTLLEGKDFIRRYRRGGMGWSQAIIIDHEMALSLKAYDEPFVVNGAISRRLCIAQDDCFSYVFIMSAMGTVGLCEKQVCEIGMPRESYSRSNRSWMDTKGKVKFIIFYNLSRADFEGKYASEVKRMAFKQALQYADRIFDTRIAEYYKWNFGIILLMGFSLLKRAWSEIRYAFKRAVNLIKPNTFKKTMRR
jgi:glycosyltransferase involved in cell wall biosynthesis